jgi:flagellar hook-basal body complex protein FliE
MVDPITSQSLGPVGAVAPESAAKAAPSATTDFAAALREQLEKVSAMQTEADEGAQRLLTGESQNITEVFTAARKAEVAFTLLMEIRNKLVDAYTELRQVRV